jgi:hypothetical protein
MDSKQIPLKLLVESDDIGHPLKLATTKQLRDEATAVLAYAREVLEQLIGRTDGREGACWDQVMVLVKEADQYADRGHEYAREKEAA